MSSLVGVVPRRRCGPGSVTTRLPGVAYVVVLMSLPLGTGHASGVRFAFSVSMQAEFEDM